MHSGRHRPLRQAPLPRHVKLQHAVQIIHTLSHKLYQFYQQLQPHMASLKVRLHPGARRNAITGTHDGALKISLTAPPVDGKANESLIAFLADLLHVPKSSISLTSGQTSRQKTLEIQGKSAAELTALLPVS
jgi:uncharacterized protein (TIGR00251 family)